MIHIKVTDIGEEFKNLLKGTLERLHEQAPSDSDIRTKIGKIKEGYSGVLEVISTQGRFCAKAIDGNVKDLARKLLTQIHEQLSIWKKDRFVNMPLGDLR